MVGNIIENNLVTISGKIATLPEFSHDVYGEVFYRFMLDVQRLSKSMDRIPVTVSERLTGKDELTEGRLIEVEGQFRSYNSQNENSNRLILTVFAREVRFINEKEIRNPNSIYLNGYVCKRPIYRTTPFNREISDILIAVNRPYNKSDYIPCISWGRNARYTKNLDIGDNIHIWGRVQSRQYQKKSDPEKIETRTAFEVSISRMELVRDDE